MHVRCWVPSAREPLYGPTLCSPVRAFDIYNFTQVEWRCLLSLLVRLNCSARTCRTGSSTADEKWMEREHERLQ